jgi:hypothetical protein
MTTISVLIALGMLLVLVVGKAEDNANPNLPVVYVTFSVPRDGTDKQGLYWAGIPGESMSNEKPYFGNSDFEHLVTVLSPGQDITERVTDGHSMVMRSADMTSRARLTLSRNTDASTATEYPFIVRIVNLSIMDRDGPFPLELVHGIPNEFIWIEPADFVEHLTGPEHEFWIRSKDHMSQFKIAFRMPSEEL